MINKQALMDHIVLICICSTTTTILDPNARVLIDWASSTTLSAGLIRFVGVYVRMCTPIDKAVKNTYYMCELAKCVKEIRSVVDGDWRG